MFVVNDPKGRWVNGTLGVITDMKHKSLTVQIFGGEEVQVTPHIWKVSQYVYKFNQSCFSPHPPHIFVIT